MEHRLTCFKPEDVDPHRILPGSVFDHPGGDWSKTLQYEGNELCIRINNARLIFGIVEYSNPSGQTQISKRYSTALCLDHLSHDTQRLGALILAIEEIAKQELDDKEFNFISTVKVNSKEESSVRIKVPIRNSNVLMFSVYINGTKQMITFDDLKKLIYHDMIVDVIVSLGALWCSGGKYGISWKLKAVGINEHNF
jgi:hypothetical protein